MEKNQQNNEQIVNHLVDLIRSELDEKNNLKGLDKIEVFSHYLRTNAFKFKQFLEDGELRKKVDKKNEYTPYSNDLNKLKQRLQRIQKGKSYTMPDLMQQYQALKLAGISIGQTNCMNLNKAIKCLAIENDVKQIRFWGKIMGYQDYYVIQGISSKNYINDLGPNSESYGIGVNSYSYWVSTKILGNWIQLPLVSPEHMKGSREFKYVFTGDLEKDIKGGKSFKGKQKDLLKCVIARITHSCQLVPKGLLKVNEQNNTVQYEEEFKIPEVAELNSLQNWVHLNPHILSQGRTSYYIDPKLNEEERGNLLAELGQKEPMVQRLKGITQDKAYEAMGYASTWVNQLCGETVPINQIGKLQGQSFIYGIALLKNLSWPGAHTIGYKGGWTNIYIGYGHRISQQNNIIKDFKDVLVEGQDHEEKSEPNPSKAPEPEKKQEEGEKPAQEGAEGGQGGE